MSNPIKVGTSILSCDFTKLGEEIKKCEDAGADLIHVDVMDGNFVPNISIGQCILEAIRPITKLPIETHLMIEHPWFYIDEFADLGADIISIHAECYGQRRPGRDGDGEFPKVIDSLDDQRALRDINKIKAKGKKAFMVLNPDTPMCLDNVLGDLDGVLIMSVNPGFSGQSFIASVLDKARDLRKVFEGDIAIDGGVNAQTAKLAVEAGINVLDTASYFFKASDQKQAIDQLKRLKSA